MAIRNYVGARYVPKFADPIGWQANTSYEAMVIVTYNNSSYTSKIPVPPTVGNPAENSKYWVLTGNYNAQIEEYRQETADAQEHARDSICAVDEGNNTTASKEHKRYDYFWWNGKLYQALNDIHVGDTLRDNFNVKETDIASSVASLDNSYNDVTVSLSDIEGNITDIQTKVNTNTNDISGLKTNYTRVETNLTGHINNKANPHGVTKAQVGLGNVDNVSKANILLSVYPVGSIYMSTASTSPAELFGGTWERIKDRFLLAVGDTYTAGSTGGEATHTLTEDEMPTHRHIINPAGYVQDFAIGTGYTTAVIDPYGNKGDVLTSFKGGSQPHNNMPPYLAVFMWKRIA